MSHKYMIKIKKPEKLEYAIIIRLTKKQAQMLDDLAYKHETSKNKIVQAILESTYEEEF